MLRRPRLVLAALVAAAALAVGSLAGLACLPDLASLPASAAEDASTVLALAACGNGIIDTDAETCDPGDASAPGCDACTIACEGRLDSTTGHCYFSAGPAAKQSDAETLCRARGAHLVTLGSLAEATFASAVALHPPFWVGLAFQGAAGAYVPGTPLGLEPGWPQQGTGPCTGCFGLGLDGGGVDGGGNCIVETGLDWSGVDCQGSPREAVCEREPRGRRYQSCNGGLCFSLPETSSKKTYLTILARERADSARQTCSGLGGTLVVLESTEERAAIVRELAQMLPLDDTIDPSVDFWIGLYSDDAGAWSWESGKTGLLPPPWGNGEPVAPVPSGSNAFLSIRRDYDTALVHAEPGGASHFYLCELSR